MATAAQALALAAVSPSLVGCGQKGPLSCQARAAAASCRAAPAPATASRRRADIGAGAALMDLPGAPDIACRDGRAAASKASPRSTLARRFGTPLYVYSRAAMARALAVYQRALAGRDHLLCYA